MTTVAQSKFPSWRLDFGEIKAKIREDANQIDWEHFFRIWTGCVLIFLTSYLIAYLKTGQLPLFASNAEEVRSDFLSASTLSYYGLAFGPFSLMLVAEAFLFGHFTRTKKTVLWLGFVLVLLLYLIVVTRFELFRIGIFSMVLIHYGRKNLRWHHLLGGILFAALIFFLAFVIRVKQDAVGALNEAIQVKLPKEWLWASGFYAYLANDFWNMNYAFQKFGDGLHEYPMQWGLGLMRALTMEVLRIEPGLIKTFGYDTIMNGMVTRAKGLNTVVYVWHFYKDFGTIGVFGMTLFGGLWTAKFHKNLLFSPSLKQLSLWGCVIGAVVLSFHIPSWELWFFLVNILVLVYAHRYSTFPK